MTAEPAIAEPKILDKLQGVRPEGHNHWMTFCPSHPDGEKHGKRSLSVTLSPDGKTLINCLAGCTFQDIIGAAGVMASQLFSAESRNGYKGGVSYSPDQHRNGATPPGCTLREYSEAKRLPAAFLRGLGCSDMRHQHYGCDVVRMPHYAPDRTVAATLYRLALSGEDKTRWKGGSKATLYGLDRLERARKAGYVVIVEGQSDCHTLWYHNVPALGLPGASNAWDKLTAELLEGIGTIYVVIEPDTGGETVLRKLKGCPVRDRMRILRLDPYKDPSALHIAGPDRFEEAWSAALGASVPWRQLQEREVTERAGGAWELCRELAQSPDVLSLAADTVASLGVAGETRAVKLLYLAAMSRLLEGDRPVSIAVKGPSSAGKSYTTERVLSLFPPSAYYALSSMSERALAYSEEPLEHRMLVIYEAAGMAGDFTSYLIRSLLSEGCIRYETVEKTSEGMRPRVIERKGPTGLIVTTTALHLHPENETRILSVPVSDTADQTRAVLRALAVGAKHEPDLSRWHALSDWLETAEHRVAIPYALELAEQIPPAAVRLRRDFVTLKSLICVHALLHQTTRGRDNSGRVVATVADYAAVRELVHDLIAEGVEQAVPESVRETVQAVERLATDAGVSTGELAKALKLDKSAVSRRARSAVERGYLRNLEERNGKPSRLVIGDSMPEHLEILPRPELLHCCSDYERDKAPLPPSQPPDCGQCGDPAFCSKLGHCPFDLKEESCG